MKLFMPQSKFFLYYSHLDTTAFKSSSTFLDTNLSLLHVLYFLLSTYYIIDSNLHYFLNENEICFFFLVQSQVEQEHFLG